MGVTKTKAKPKSGVVIPQKADWKGRLLARVIWTFANTTASTLRFQWRDDSGLFEREPDGPILFCIWHNRLALSLILYRNYVRSRFPNRRLAAMVSASRDGGMLARVLELFDVQPIRGSSSKRGTQALREANSFLRAGLDIAITPDGPRGPCYELQPGLISLGQLTGRPIVPVSYRLSWKIRLKSWDRFLIPLPFARCDVRLGKPIEIPRKLSEDRMEELRRELEDRMRAITINE